MDKNILTTADELFDKGQYEEAMNLYAKAAEQGIADAQQRLGNSYYNANGVERNYEQAVCWYTKAMENGSVQAQCDLGFCHVYGFGVEKDYERAITLFKDGVDKNDYYAQICLGVCYELGIGVAKDKKQAERLYKLAIEDVGKIAKDIAKSHKSSVKLRLSAEKWRNMGSKVKNE